MGEFGRGSNVTGGSGDWSLVLGNSGIDRYYTNNLERE